jgi:hypothetical protein
MHPAARSGYLYLLTFQWQTEDCTIPSDPLELADISEIGDELWATHGARILRNFKSVEDGKLRNDVCFEEWKEAKFVYERRRQAAEKTNAPRSPHGHRLRKDENVQRSADTGTVTGTVTVTSTEKKKPFARSVPPEELAGTLPLANGTDFQVSKSDVDRWVQAFPGVSVKQELKKFKAWCEDNPTKKKTAKGVKSAVFRWLDKAQNYGGGNGTGEQSKKRTEGNAGAEGGEDGPDLYAALYEPIEQGKLN